MQNTVNYTEYCVIACEGKGSWLCGSDGRVCLQYKRPGFDPWVGKIPWTREWLPTPVFLPGEFHGDKNLVHGVAKSQT